jgi:putative phage-type endonuclease
MSPQIICADRKEWLEKRRNFIGGSEAATLMGIGYMSELELWERKVFPQDESEEEIEFLEWGHILEQPIAERYVLKTGRRLIDPGPYVINYSEKYPWASCTLDRQIANVFDLDKGSVKVQWPEYAEGPAELSIKNAGWYVAKDWDEEIPTSFQVQNNHNMAVMGWKWNSTAALLGGNQMRWADSQRNDSFISTLMELEESFWYKVQHGIRPDPDGSEGARKALLRMHKKDNGKSVLLPAEAYLWSANLREAKAQIKRWEAIKDLNENLITAAIGDYTEGVFPKIETAQLAEMPSELTKAIMEHPSDILSHTWKHQSRAEHVVKYSEFRVLRESKK